MSPLMTSFKTSRADLCCWRQGCGQAEAWRGLPEFWNLLVLGVCCVCVTTALSAVGCASVPLAQDMLYTTP